jgi:RING finger protein 113A
MAMALNLGWEEREKKAEDKMTEQRGHSGHMIRLFDDRSPRLRLYHRYSTTTSIMAESVAVPFFKKKRARPTTTRQRTPSPPVANTTPSASMSKSQVVLPSRKAGTNLLSAGTKRTSSQRRAEDPDADDNSDDSGREGPGINWTSTGGHVNRALEILAGDEAEEMLAKRVRKADSDEDDVPNDGLYHGQKSYKTHIKKSQEVPKSMRTGPVRSNNSTIRTVTVVDYQPDVCKDYKGAHAVTHHRQFD